MSFQVKVDSSRVQVRLDAMPGNVRSALRDVVTTLDNELLARVKDKTPDKTGKLIAAFRGHVRSTKTKVTGSVDVDKNAKGQRGIVAILESGADVPAHEILPDVKKALAFLGGGVGGVWARVQHPADHIPAVHMLRDSLDEMSSEIVADIEQAVDVAVAGGA